MGIYQRHVLFLAYDKGILICNKGMAWGEHLGKKSIEKQTKVNARKDTRKDSKKFENLRHIIVSRSCREGEMARVEY